MSHSPILSSDPRAVKCPGCHRLMHPGELCGECAEKIRPDWFREETGFAFRDGDGDNYIVLGIGKFSSMESVGSITAGFVPAGITLASTIESAHALIAVLCYRGDFILVDLTTNSYDIEFWNHCLPVPRSKGSMISLEDAGHRGARQEWSRG